MVDNHTVLLLGWKVEGDKKVEEIKHRLESADKNWFDKFVCDFFIYDTMMGNYLYFGAIIENYDSENDMTCERIIEDEFIETEKSRYEKFLKDNPEIAKILEEYKETKGPNLYLFQHIW